MFLLQEKIFWFYQFHFPSGLNHSQAYTANAVSSEIHTTFSAKYCTCFGWKPSSFTRLHSWIHWRFYIYVFVCVLKIYTSPFVDRFKNFEESENRSRIIPIAGYTGHYRGKVEGKCGRAEVNNFILSLISKIIIQIYFRVTSLQSLVGKKRIMMNRMMVASPQLEHWLATIWSLCTARRQVFRRLQKDSSPVRYHIAPKRICLYIYS